MSKSSYDTFALVVNFINQLDYVLCHITIGLFEAHDTYVAILAKQVKVLWAKFNLIKNIIAYVKDKRADLNSLTIAFTSIVSYELLQLV